MLLFMHQLPREFIKEGIHRQQNFTNTNTSFSFALIPQGELTGRSCSSVKQQQ